MTTSGETSQNEASPNGHQATLRSVAGDVPVGFQRPEHPPQPSEEDIQAAKALAAEEAALAQIREWLAGDPAKLILYMLQQLPNLLAESTTSGVAAALARTTVRTAGRLCTVCLGARFTWETLHAADMEAAKATAMAILGTANPDDPRLAQVDLAEFLPAHLKPGAEPDGMPTVYDGMTTDGGLEICPGHHPGAPKKGTVAAAGRKEFLVAGAPLSSFMIRQAGGLPGVFAGMPEVPGVPG